MTLLPAAGATVVDAMPWFRAQGRCPAVIGSTIPMRDTEHVTPTYAAALALQLATSLGLAPARRAATAAPSGRER